MGSKLFWAASTILTIAVSISVGFEVVSCSPGPKDCQILGSEKFPIINATGLESVVFDRYGGGPYTGISDGRIIRWLSSERRWTNFAITTPNRNSCEGPQDHIPTESRCGLPLGLSFNRKSGKLYIADAYKGLLVVGPNGGLATPLANEAEGVLFKFTNDVVVDENSGVVYFTDSSTIYSVRDSVSVISTGDKSGRLLKFDPKTNQATVLLNNLMLPNGVALSKNGDFLLVAETTNSRILKYCLEPSKAGTVEIFAKLLGRPNNIKRNQKGEFWVAVRSLDTKVNPYGSIVKLSQNGDILKILEAGNGEAWRYGSDANEQNKNLWIGSFTEPYVAKLKIYC
ncbi:protein STRICTOSIDINE SYNTHASE-LIKE 2 [Coffea arabica]|uniref:Protein STRICTOSIDINE SYNTHASE-LIKE 2 n=1 Tax=Coffea arabica TaxID=13443 RepID=A0A6P6VJS0_COFAR